MAKLYGINTKMRGSVGQYNFYQRAGETCVREKVAPYQITRGSLPSILVSDSTTGNIKKTDIAVGSTFAITSATTVKDFSDEIIAHNPNYKDGDQIAVFILRQLVNAATGVPYVVVEAEAFNLNTSDNVKKVRDIVSEAGFSIIDECIGANNTVNGGIVWVHSRETQNRTLVGTQFIEVSNALLAQYQTKTKMDEAIESYGGVNGVDFLTPKTDEDDEPGPGPVPPSDAVVTLALDPEDAGVYSINGEHVEVGAEYTYPVGAELEVQVPFTMARAKQALWQTPSRKITKNHENKKEAR